MFEVCGEQRGVVEAELLHAGYEVQEEQRLRVVPPAEVGDVEGGGGGGEERTVGGGGVPLGPVPEGDAADVTREGGA